MSAIKTKRERAAAPGKKRYRVTGTLTITVITDVEATSEADARDLALDLPVMTLCNQCADGDPKVHWITSGELDGSPEIVEVTHHEG